MGEHVTERILADNFRMHARTFRLCALFSSSELPVLVVRHGSYVRHGSSS